MTIYDLLLTVWNASLLLDIFLLKTGKDSGKWMAILFLFDVFYVAARMIG